MDRDETRKMAREFWLERDRIAVRRGVYGLLILIGLIVFINTLGGR